MKKKFFRQIAFLDFHQLEVADVVESKHKYVCLVIDLADRASQVAEVLDSAPQNFLKK